MEFLKNARRAAVITHKRADPDALACGRIVQIVLEKLGIESVLACPEGSPLGGCANDVPSDVDVYILVDVASLSQVPPLSKPLFRIDHHYMGDEIQGIWKIRPSCVEIALELAEEAEVELPLDVAKLAILGIYHDTGRLRRADAEALSKLAKLLERVGGTLGEHVEEERKVDSIALLKGLQRVKAYRSKFGLLCTSYVGAYESEVASLLVSLGCRVAIVASRKRDGVHVVMRSRDFDVASIARGLGAGGGHREAAVAVIRERMSKGELPIMLRKIVYSIDSEAKALV